MPAIDLESAGKNSEIVELTSYEDGESTVRSRYSSPDQINNRRVIYSSSKFISLLQRIWDGPQIARDDPPKISNPKLKRLEQYPQVFKQLVPRKLRLLLLLGYMAIWYSIIYFLLAPVFSHGPLINGQGANVISLSCSGDGFFWKGKNEKCGLNGEECTSLDDGDIIIKCPALCDRGWVYSATPVGNKLVKYIPYVIGGGYKRKKSHENDDELTLPYRSDSFPCTSAVHGGALSPFFGGCVKLSFQGPQISFKSQSAFSGSSYSIEFPSFFPSSYIFKRLPNGLSRCYDPRLIILCINFLFGIPVIYLANGSFGYWITLLVGFWTIMLTLDPPIIVDANDRTEVARLFSIGFERLLPLSFVLYVIWETTVKKTFSEPTSSLAKMFVWYPLFWIGAANNITFDRLPIDRLTPHDIKEQPGALLAITGVLVIITFFSLIQGYQIWRSGRAQRYIKLYGVVFVVLNILAFLPGLQLRIHHYILGILLVFGTATKGISAFLLQGVLVGLTLSGVARWDFASIVETHVSLMRGEAGSSSKPPTNLSFTQGYLTWDPMQNENYPKELDGFSLLVNDVETYIGNATYVDVEELISNHKTLKHMVEKALDANSYKDIELFIRLAKGSSGADRLRSDYTRAGVLRWPSGEWTDPGPGVT